jgi:predicted MFS family arabinose efflux permease
MHGETPTAPVTAATPLAASPLDNPQFRWLLASNLSFFLALHGQGVVRAWLAYELTGSKLALGQIAAAVALPMLLIAPLGGVIADRVERRRLILFGQAAVFTVELALLLLLWSGRLAFWHLLCGTFVIGVSFPMSMPARQAIVAQLVARERLTSAMAIGSGVFNASRVLGPLLSGVLIDVVRVRGAYTVGTALYLLAMLTLLGVSRSRAERKPGRSAPLAHDMAEGVRYLASQRLVLVLLGFGLVPMLLAMPVQQLMVVFAQEVFHVGSSGFGVLQAVAGVGGVAGAIWVTRLRGTNRLRAMFAAALAFPVLLGLFALSPWFWPAVGLAFVGYAMSSAFVILNNTAIQLLVPDRVRGRVSSFMMMSVSLPLLGTLPVGALADRFGAPLAVACACAAAMLAAVGFWFGSPALRRLDARLAEGRPDTMPPSVPPP